ncbi:hypothetical protein O181_078612 [Austropuccinia psidii MF-1]|uniref:Uncharacterized protein n=1 Tax=Austropuccinia psidii MF-1 TaxID=1389203 RepID=A0A9Q3FI57_9BASI|nr:hypothetical protein [Austropuccinia psidii MF-1]
MNLNQVISNNTRKTELSQEITIAEDMYEIGFINIKQGFQNKFISSQRCNTSKINEIEQLLHILPRISTPLNQNEGIRTSNSQVVDVENSQLINEFSTSFHKLELSTGQEPLKEVPKLK